MPASPRNRDYRNVATGEIVWAERMLNHNRGAALGTGDWEVRHKDGTTTTMSHDDFAAKHVPAE